MRTLAEVVAIVVGSILAVFGLCGLGWFLVMVVLPLGLSIALIFSLALLTLAGMIALAERR